MTHTTTWVSDIASVAGNDVDVQVHDGLASSLSRVDADVVAVRLQLNVELALDLIDKRKEGVLFDLRCLEPSGHFAPRDDKRVAGRDRKSIANGKRQVVAGDVLAGWLGEED